jgi:hypothetical protein
MVTMITISGRRTGNPFMDGFDRTGQASTPADEERWQAVLRRENVRFFDDPDAAEPAG